MPVSMLAIFGALASGLFSFFGFPPFNRWMNYDLNRMLPNALPTLSESIEAYYRGLIDYETLKDWVKAHGYDEDKLKLFLNMYKRLYSLDMLITMKFRGIITDEEFYQEMEKEGYDRERAEKILQISWTYPPVSDWIRFAVRDVFNEEIVKKYGYDEDFPEAIVEFAEKAGVDRQTLLWYWRAHWDLPSPTAGYEMLHRLQPEVIDMKLPDGSRYGDKYKEMGVEPDKIKTDLDTLRELLRVSDIPKYWRDRLIAIAYNTLTRVDLRRIYKLGLISDEEVLGRLMEYGYTKKDAELLLQWFKAEKMPSERDLTKSEILKLYHYRFIDEKKAKDLLLGLGYDEDEAEFLVLLEDYKVYNEIVEEKLSILRTLYVRGIIDDQKLLDELNKLALPSHKIQYELERAQREKVRAQKLPSKSDLDKMFSAGVITEEKYRKTLKLLGYSEDWIERYVKLLKGG